MNILLVDQPLWNRGDESAHKGLVRSILKAIPNAKIRVMELGVSPAAIDEFDMKLPQVEFVNITPLNEVWFNRVARHSYRWNAGWTLTLCPTGNKIKRLYKWADMVMMAPGGINLGGFQDWRHLSLLLLARSMGKPLAYYGRSIGPFTTATRAQRRFRHLAKKALEYCSFVGLRDEKSVNVARELGINCTPTVDSAFLDATEADVPDDVRRIIGGGEYIVFVPNELVWHYAYRNTVQPQTINRFYADLVRLFWRDLAVLKALEAVIADNLAFIVPLCLCNHHLISGGSRVAVYACNKITLLGLILVGGVFHYIDHSLQVRFGVFGISCLFGIFRIIYGVVEPATHIPYLTHRHYPDPRFGSR